MATCPEQLGRAAAVRQGCSSIIMRGEHGSGPVLLLITCALGILGQKVSPSSVRSLIPIATPFRSVVGDCIPPACIIICPVQGHFGLQRTVKTSQRQCIHCIQQLSRLKTRTQEGVFTYTTGKIGIHSESPNHPLGYFLIKEPMV